MPSGGRCLGRHAARRAIGPSWSNKKQQKMLHASPARNPDSSGHHPRRSHAIHHWTREGDPPAPSGFTRVTPPRRGSPGAPPNAPQAVPAGDQFPCTAPHGLGTHGSGAMPPVARHARAQRLPPPGPSHPAASGPPELSRLAKGSRPAPGLGLPTSPAHQRRQRR